MRSPALAGIAVLLAVPLLPAQDRLKSMPGYARYQEVGTKIQRSFKTGSLSAKWTDGGKALEYKQAGKSWSFDIASLQASEQPESKAEAEPERGGRPGARRGAP